MSEKIRRSVSRITSAIDRHEPVAVVAAFSGGHDSLAAAHVASRLDAFDGALHLHTGIGIEDTRRFVRDTCDRLGWALHEYKAAEYVRADGTPDPQIYENMVRERGFPGPGMHWRMYHRLKLRPLEQWQRETKNHQRDRVVIVSGRRRQESARRMQIEGVEDREGSRVWVQALLDWSKRDVLDYIDSTDELQRNRVATKLCGSKECCCGAFARDGELTEIGALYPEFEQRIRALENEIEFPWGWEEGPPEWWAEWNRGQEFLPGTAPDDSYQPMCQSCRFRAKRNED